MQKYYYIFRYVGVAAIVLLILGLGGWFLFLRNQEGNLSDLASQRGFDIAIPSFTGARSSTSENIAAGATTEGMLSVQTAEKPPRLWRVSSTPIAGASFIGASSTLRYIERSTGHVYDVDPVSGKAERRTNTLVPKIYDAAIASDGSMILRTLDDAGGRIAIAATFGTTTQDGFFQLETANLGAAVFATAFARGRPDTLLVAESANGAELVRSRADAAPQSLLSLFLTTLEPMLVPDGRILLTERPASGMPSSSYEVVNGALVPLVRGIPGLAVLPRPSSSVLLYSSDDGARLRLFARSATSSTAELSIGTSARKCVWAPSGVSTTTPTLYAYCAVPQTAPSAGFTDSWVRGATHTADAWYTIDISAAKSERFFIPEGSIALDVEDPMIDARGEYITFTNARDKSLWLLRITD